MNAFRRAYKVGVKPCVDHELQGPYGIEVTGLLSSNGSYINLFGSLLVYVRTMYLCFLEPPQLDDDIPCQGAAADHQACPGVLSKHYGSCCSKWS